MSQSKQYKEIVAQIARQMNLDPRRVAHTLNSIFSQKGIQYHMGDNNRIFIDGVGMFKPGMLHWRKLKREKFSRQVFRKHKYRKGVKRNAVRIALRSLSETEKQELITYF